MPLPHENLVAWQRADDLFIEVHRLTHQRFPTIERYELAAQVRRAAWSVPANIVEGIADGTTRESIRFLKIARRSLSELSYGFHSAHRLGYITQAELESFGQKVRAIGGPLRGPHRKTKGHLEAQSGKNGDDCSSCRRCLDVSPHPRGSRYTRARPPHRGGLKRILWQWKLPGVTRTL
jgi:four helix bundle protein